MAVYLLGQHSGAGVRAAASEQVLILLVPGVFGVNMFSPCLHVVSLDTPASFHSLKPYIKGTGIALSNMTLGECECWSSMYKGSWNRLGSPCVSVKGRAVEEGWYTDTACQTVLGVYSSLRLNIHKGHSSCKWIS